MSEWHYSEEELDQYFNDPDMRRDALSENGQTNGTADAASGWYGFWYRRFHDRQKAQAASALSILVAALLVGLLLLGGVFWSLVDDVPSTQRLENPTFQLASVAYTADGEELARYARQNRSWVPYDSISSAAIGALVATEDHRFREHWGVDLQGIAAAVVDILTGNFRGASTITQQLARNLYNEEVGREVTVTRKLKEMVTAVELERRYTKREIVEMYLNTVSFGFNAYGIDAAANTFFGTSAKNLDTLQAATLIGMLKATTYYNPVRNPENAKQRRNVVLQQMVKRDRIAPSFYAEHKDDPVDATYHSAELYASLAPYFAEHVRNWMEDWSEANGRDLYADGLRIYTTLDSKLQRMARKAAERQMSGLQKVVEYEWSEPSGRLYGQSLEDYRDLVPGEDYTPFAYFWETHPEALRTFIRRSERYRGLRRAGTSPEAALTQLRSNDAFMDSLKTANSSLENGLVSINPNNGHVKVWIGGRDFRDDKYDKVAIAKRQPGSTFKPFTYITAVDNGYSPYMTLPDSVRTYQIPGADTTWAPGNFGAETGQMYTLSQGLARSMNTVTAGLVNELGLNSAPGQIASYARRMGITTPMEPVPSIALGTSDVKLLDMATAYSTLASGGIQRDPVVVTRIEDRYGNVLWEGMPRSEEALSERTAYTVVDMLRGVIDYGTGIRVRTQFRLGRYDLAGKTGTTQEAADTWFMLMHPNLVTGAWVGFNDRRLTFRTNWWGQGSHSALFLVGDFYNQLMEEDLVLRQDDTFPMVSLEPPATAADSTRQGRPDGRVGW
jgi:penicillin-binding protein 1A